MVTQFCKWHKLLVTYVTLTIQNTQLLCSKVATLFESVYTCGGKLFLRTDGGLKNKIKRLEWGVMVITCIGFYECRLELPKSPASQVSAGTYRQEALSVWVSAHIGLYLVGSISWCVWLVSDHNHYFGFSFCKLHQVHRWIINKIR